MAYQQEDEKTLRACIGDEAYVTRKEKRDEERSYGHDGSRTDRHGN